MRRIGGRGARWWVARLSLLLAAAAGVAGAQAPGALAYGESGAISVGDWHTCAVTAGGHAVCWGDPEEGATDVPGDLGPVTAVSAGGWHSCAIKTNGTAVCWGDKHGYGKGAARVPRGLGPVRAISAGVYHSCAVKTDGHTVCWGSDEYAATDVPGDIGDVRQLSVNYLVSCVVEMDDTPRCWGSYDSGQQAVPADKVSAISLGRFHACAVEKDGTPRCWGYEWHIGGPVDVPDGIGPVTAISAGSAQTCAIKTNGTPVCWGDWDHSSGSADVPADIGPVTAISAGTTHTCAVQTSGRVVCWGQNDRGQIDVPEGTVVPPSAGTPAGWSAPAGVRADFNGDGFGDLAIGVPGENSGAGFLHVLYGSASGLRSNGSQLLSQDSRGVPGDSEPRDAFGAALAAGDVNGDGKADLMVGAPGENEGAGAVYVLLGSASRLTGTGSRYLSQNTAGVQDVEEAGDGFGSALAVGDFGGTGADDLATGIPGEDNGSAGDSGAVEVLFGSASGISSSGSQFFTQDSGGISGMAEPLDRFGSSLAAGNFASSAKKDLAIGAPGENDEAGVVHVLAGAGAGLTTVGSQVFGQGTDGVSDAGEPGDAFGAVLAAGDLGGNAFDDLAVGVPLEDSGAVPDAGAVHLLRGSSAGLTVTGQQYWTQDSAGIAGGAEAGDLFGAALAVGELGHGSRQDLAVGAPGENDGAGVVHVLPGAAAGLIATGSQLVSQDTAGVSDRAEVEDEFGTALTAANFGDSAEDDLAIGTPGEDVGTAADAGAVNVLPGSAAGLTTTGEQYWTQASTGIAGGAEPRDRFGAGLGR